MPPRCGKRRARRFGGLAQALLIWRASTRDPAKPSRGVTTSGVTRGLDPRVHFLRKTLLRGRWIAGSGPAMTEMAAIECEREPPISENYDYPKTTSRAGPSSARPSPTQHQGPRTTLRYKKGSAWQFLESKTPRELFRRALVRTCGARRPGFFSRCRWNFWVHGVTPLRSERLEPNPQGSAARLP